MEHDYVLCVSIDPVKNCIQVVKCVVVAHHHQDVAWTNADYLRGEVLTRLQIELIKCDVLRGVASRYSFGDAEDGKENDREGDSSKGGDLFSEQVDQA